MTPIHSRSHAPEGEIIMESRRALGLLIAVISAILIILAGRSCAKSIDETNKKSRKPSAPIQILTEPKATAALATDQPQQPIPPEALTEDPTLPPEEETADPDIPTTTKSKLDEFWDSEQPSYLHQYSNGSIGGGKINSTTNVHIEIY